MWSSWVSLCLVELQSSELALVSPWHLLNPRPEHMAKRAPVTISIYLGPWWVPLWHSICALGHPGLMHYALWHSGYPSAGEGWQGQPERPSLLFLLGSLLRHPPRRTLTYALRLLLVACNEGSSSHMQVTKGEWRGRSSAYVVSTYLTVAPQEGEGGKYAGLQVSSCAYAVSCCVDTLGGGCPAGEWGKYSGLQVRQHVGSRALAGAGWGGFGCGAVGDGRVCVVWGC